MLSKGNDVSNSDGKREENKITQISYEVFVWKRTEKKEEGTFASG